MVIDLGRAAFDARAPGGPNTEHGRFRQSVDAENGLWADPARDYFHGDRIRACAEAGLCGLQRVLAPPTECPQLASGALQCLSQD